MSPDTNGKLLRYHEQFSRLDDADSVFIGLLRSRINDFYNNNAIRIETIKKKLKDIDMDYYVYEVPLDLGAIDIKTAQKVSPIKKFVGEGAERKPVLQEGKLEVTMQQEILQLLNTPIEIHF